MRTWPNSYVVLIAGVGLISSLFAIRSLRGRAASQPAPIVLSTCTAAPEVGTHRVKSDFGTEFDVPDSEFTIRSGARDMPGGMLYVVALKGQAANMVIWRDDEIFHELKSAFPVFSERVEDRDILNTSGRVVGRDHWGYLKDGERWRYVTFSAGDALGYHPSTLEQARLFDQIISSACVSPGPGASPTN